MQILRPGPTLAESKLLGMGAQGSVWASPSGDSEGMLAFESSLLWSDHLESPL